MSTREGIPSILKCSYLIDWVSLDLWLDEHPHFSWLLGKYDSEPFPRLGPLPLKLLTTAPLSPARGLMLKGLLLWWWWVRLQPATLGWRPSQLLFGFSQTFAPRRPTAEGSVEVTTEKLLRLLLEQLIVGHQDIFTLFGVTDKSGENRLTSVEVNGLGSLSQANCCLFHQSKRFVYVNIRITVAALVLNWLCGIR